MKKSYLLRIIREEILKEIKITSPSTSELAKVYAKIREYIKNGSKGDLDLSEAPIQSLPNDLEIEGSLYLRDTPLSKKYTEEQIRRMVPGVQGDIYL
jgi:hypothetical protein